MTRTIFRIGIGTILSLIALFVVLQIWFASTVRPVEPFVPNESERAQLALYSQPESWFVAHLSGGRTMVDGQVLDAKLQYMAEQNNGVSDKIFRAAPLIFATPWGRAWVRHGVDRSWLLLTKVTPDMASVEDRAIQGRGGAIPIRIYRPKVANQHPLPILVYLHGGGWIFSSIVAEDRVARLIANEAKVIVVSVDYRLAPEHPYPAASDDGEDTYLWARGHAASFGGDPTHIGVGGDSAGGHVAIDIALRQLRAGRPLPAAMLLFYPGAGLPQEDRSYRLFGKGYMLDARFIEFILPRVFQQYRPGHLKEADELMNPAGARTLKGMPPAVIATAGFDILRDSGRRFADRLTADGVPVSYTNYPSLTHSFLQFSAVVPEADIASTRSARLFGEVVRNPASARTILVSDNMSGTPE